MGLLDRPKLVGRSDGIDLLRITLALWVVLTHLSEWGPLSATGIAAPLGSLDRWSESLFQGHGETHPAVIAFIVLSGYCIHRGGGRSGAWSPRRYAVKRFFRIVPVYVIASLIGAALFLIATRANTSATLAASATSQIGLHGLAFKLSTLTAIIPIAHMATNPLNGYEGNGPLYTVAAEIWLYAFYAAIVTLLVRRQMTERHLALVIAVLFAGGLLLTAADPSSRTWWFNGSMIAFLPLWWLGACAVGLRASGRFLAVSAVLWLVASLYLRGRGGLLIEETRMLAFGVLAANLIGMIDRARVRLPARAGPLPQAGYSLYAFHAPVLILLVALGIAWPVVLAVALLAAVVTFRLVEDPATQLGRRLAISDSAVAPRSAALRS